MNAWAKMVVPHLPQKFGNRGKESPQAAVVTRESTLGF
jgi:hypothetical protein